MPDPYRELAPLFDMMAADPALQAFYAEWKHSLLAAAASHGIRPRVIVDLACGTGNSTIPWAAKRGRTVIGVDVSEAMLRVARRKSARVRWVRQDMTMLGLDVQADLVTCHFDALNHLLDARSLHQMLVGVFRILRPGGLFQFDLNTRYWLQWLSTSEKLFHVGPHYFTAFNAFDAASGIATFNQLWFVKQRRLYRKVLVSVRERSYEDSELRRMLREAGLRLEHVSVQRRVKGRPIRKVYLAVKPANPLQGA